ncbi:MAG: GNAT family N-acetyltransferase [Armatimonadetes bacterium]|nr:GNAT family N-acetyltransferase [Armatimonadota bacterium]
MGDIDNIVFLAEPSVDYRDSFLEAVREFESEGSFVAMRELEKADWRYDRLEADFASYVQHVLRMADRTTQRPDLVPETRLWLVDDAQFVGVFSIRHELNDHLLKIGGHIGYAIRPSKRLRGYGSLVLRLGLEKAKGLGLGTVLLICDSDNIGSRKIIEANGGVLENEVEFDVDGQIERMRRYWI